MLTPVLMIALTDSKHLFILAGTPSSSSSIGIESGEANFPSMAAFRGQMSATVILVL